MIPSKMPIGRPTFKKREQCAHRSEAFKATAKNVRAAINKRLMMEFKHLRTQAIGWRTPGGIRSGTPGNWSQVNRRKPGW